MAELVTRPHFLTRRGETVLPVPAGIRAGDMCLFANIPEDQWCDFQLFIDGELETDPDRILKHGERAALVMTAHGSGDTGKDILRLFAVIIFTTLGAPYISETLIGLEKGTHLYNIVNAGVTAAGMLAINAIFPMPDQSMGNEDSQSQSFFISSQSNRATPYGIVPRIYGRHKFYPRIIGHPFMIPDGHDQYVTMIYDFGYGTVRVDKLNINDVDLSNYGYQPDLEIQIHPSFDKNSKLKIYSHDLEIYSYSYVLKKDIPHVGVLSEETDEVLLDFVASTGWLHVTKKGEHHETDAFFSLEMREKGSPTWRDASVYVIRSFSSGSIQMGWKGATNNYSMIFQLPRINEEGVVTPDVDAYQTPYNPFATTTKFQVVHPDSANDSTISPRVGQGFNWQGTWHKITSVKVYAGTQKVFELEYTPASDAPISAYNTVFIGDDPPPAGVPLPEPLYGWETPWAKANIGVPREAQVTIGREVSFLGEIREITRLTRISTPSGGDGSKDWYEAVFDKTFQPRTWKPSDIIYFNGFVTGTLLSKITAGQGTLRVWGKRARPALVTMKLVMRERKAWEFRITRTTEDKDDDTQTMDELTWQGLRGITDVAKILPDVPHTLLELRVRASEQFNGSLDKVSAVCTSLLGVHNKRTGGWPVQETRNPAWIFCDILCGTANGRPIKRSQLDLASIHRWADECDEMIPADGDYENYWIEPEIPATIQSVTVRLSHTAQPFPIVLRYVLWDGQYARISKVDRVALKNGDTAFTLTLNKHLPTIPVPEGKYHPIIITSREATLERRYTFDMVVDFKTTVREMLKMVCAAGRASPTRHDGLYGVMRERDATQPRQVITPRNSSNLNGSMVYIDLPHGFRVKYIDEHEWIEQEVLVYVKGIDPDDAYKFEDIQLQGTVRRGQAIRHGRTYLAEAELRRESVTVDMDHEHLAVTRGDMVVVATDVMEVGGLPARVTEVVGNRITLDTAYSNPAIDSVRIRYADGSVRMQSVAVVSGTDDQWTVVDATDIVDGMLVELGNKVTERNEYIVTEVTPSKDQSATLALREHRPTIITAEGGAYPPRPVRPDIGDSYVISPPRNLVVNVNRVIEDSRLHVYQELLTWQPPKTGAADHYEVWRKVDDTDFKVMGNVDTPTFTNSVSVASVDKTQTITYKIIAVASTGHESEPLSKSHTLNPDTTPPPDLLRLDHQVDGSTIHIDWDLLTNSDVMFYEIRFSPDLKGATWDRSQISVSHIGWETNTVSVPFRAGTYSIKAVDSSGNFSRTEAQTIVFPIPEDIWVDTTIVLPPWVGTHRDTKEVTNELRPVVTAGGDYVTPCYFYVNQATDFPSSQEVALTGVINGYHYSDGATLGSPHYDPLSKAIPLAFQKYLNLADWQIEFRFSNDNRATWQPWSKLTKTIVFATDIEYRVVLTTDSPDMVAASVIDARIEIAMRARHEYNSDQVIDGTGGGTRIDYQYSFYKTPTIQITPVSLPKGGYFLILESTADHFTVALFDENDNPIKGSIDWSAYGYGRA